MIIYNSTVRGFLDDAQKRDIEKIVLAAFVTRTGRTVAPNEIRSWKDSLGAAAKVLNDPSIPEDGGVAIEFGIPQTSKRIDLMLAGKNAEERDQLIIVELKQWQEARKTSKDAIVVARFQQGESEVSHPSYQAWSYATLMQNFNEAAYESDLQLRPCAYLHNCDSGNDLTDPFYRSHLERAPLFLGGEPERERLRGFIRNHIRQGDRDRIVHRIEHGRIRPSKGLVDSLAAMLAGKQEFVLIDDQKVAYEAILEIARDAAHSHRKEVVIVNGGPGSGKSVVAINLLVALTRERLLAKYVTKNRAPRQVFEKVLSGTHSKGQIEGLFGGAGAYVDVKMNAFDMLTVDEAHRLNEKSSFFGKGDHQVSELINSSKCAVFFIDDDQRVTWKDIGESQDIERRATRQNARVTHLKLASQFRCNGSDDYLAWLDDTLDLPLNGKPRDRSKLIAPLNVDEFDFRVFDSPETLRREIVERNTVRNKARMVAGYCWDWRSKKEPLALDVVVAEHGFGMKWNLSEDEGLWIIAPDSVAQIGCIHTCQGLEVDYIGVIIGPDLVARGDRIVTQPEKRSKHDKSLNGYKKLLKTDPDLARKRADLIIKNTYRALMTRGLKGCYVHSVDGETQNYLRARLTGARQSQRASS